jgi:hypothetical protein
VTFLRRAPPFAGQGSRHSTGKGHDVVVHPSLTPTSKFATAGMFVHAGLTFNCEGSALHLKNGPMLTRWLAFDPTLEQAGTTSSGSEIASGMLPVQVRL